MGMLNEREGSLPTDLRTRFDESDEPQKLWINFTDKSIPDEAAYLVAVDQLASNYNPRALERRRLRRTAPGLIDGLDLPLSQHYVEAIESTGARVDKKSRWLNAVSVHADRTQAERIAKLPCVRSLRPVRVGRREDPSASPEAGDDLSQIDRDFYGQAQTQLDQINLPALHARGYTGNGVLIGVLDSGFRRDHAAFNHPDQALSVIAEWDFMNDDPNTDIEAGDQPDQHFHGTAILGAMGTYYPEEMVGAAYDASYVLAKVEDAASEFPLEEDWFLAGLEFLESEGCDLATSSLIAYWYGQDAMDGETSVMAQAFNIATANGMHCIQAAGNSGHDDNPATSHLTTPADAFDVISCGAVEINDAIAGFSSDGPTLDGRVKPEVLARGASAWTVDAYDTVGYVTVSGTSIAAPQVAGAVACLVQAHPEWTVGQMRQRLFNTADYFLASGTHDPLFVLGYGIIDAAAAEDTQVGLPAEDEEARLLSHAHPNPFRGRTLISATLPDTGRLQLDVYDIKGRRLRRQDHGVQRGGAHSLIFDGTALPGGVYPYRLLQGGRPVAEGKLLILR
jgi:serine protease AprX